MAHRKSRKGWFGNPEGHARAAQASHDRGTKWKWVALLLIPLFFAFGWTSNQYVSDIRNDVYVPEGIQYGVGGAPSVPCSINLPGTQ